MSRREGLEHTVKVPVDGGVPPNKFKPEVTAKVAVHFPPDTPHHTVAAAVLSAAEQLLVKLDTEGSWLILGPVGQFQP